MQYVLAVDGGGTKTHALCADITGKLIGEGWSGSTNLTATTVGEASFNLQEALRQATDTLPAEAEFISLTMGVAGLDTHQEVQNANMVFEQALAHLHIQKMCLVNDTIVALASGTDASDAIVLIAGTGSHCFGRNSSGQQAKTGGMDYLLTDDGSGYAIGREILRAAVRSFDGRGPKTALEQLVCQTFQVASIPDLKNVVYHPVLTKTEVANVAKLLSPQLLQSDPVAKKIVDTACQDLALMIVTVAQQLHLDQQQTPCVLVGGIARVEEIQTGVKSEVQKTCPLMTFVHPEKLPVYGALKLALNNAQSQPATPAPPISQA